MLDQLPDWQTLSREQRIEMVQPLVIEGLSSTMIAARFRNVTRNSIIGLCHRHKWQLKGGAGRNANGIANAKARVGKPHGNKGQPKVNAIIARAARRMPKPPEFKAEPFDAETDAGVDVTDMIGLMELTNHTCRWPVGTATGSAQMFCGKHTNAGSYCPEHAARSGFGYGKGARP